MNTNIPTLEPAYDFNVDVHSIQLYCGRVEICIDGSIYVGDGEVRLDFLPKASVNFYGHFHNVPFEDRLKEISFFTINNIKVECLKLSGDLNLTSDEFNVKCCPKLEPINCIGNDSTQIKWILFHLFNFVDLIGNRKTVEQSEEKGYLIQRMDLFCDDWKVELKSLISTNENIKLLREGGGYRLTHIGCITRTNDVQFTGKMAKEFLYALRFVLSFAKGGWCEPICAIGFDNAGNRVWELWSSPKEPWVVPVTWFDPYNSYQLVELFPNFMKRWADDSWQEALREVVYWYLNANNPSRGVDAGIILTQAALERLSYEYVVKDKKLLSVDGFKNIWASDKLRLLFSSLRIPLDIPVEAHNLQCFALSKQIKWLDAPHALTEIRNSLVHPEHKHRGYYDTAYYETWNLGLWYLEMSILAICGYASTYGNRLKQRWVGEIEDVPWK